MQITKDMLMVCLPLSLVFIITIVFYLKKIAAYKKLYNRYKVVIDLNQEIEKNKDSLDRLKAEFDKLELNFKEKTDKLNTEYQSKRDIYEKLSKEINILEEDLDFMTYGIYKPHFEFDTSERYKAKLQEVVDKEKQLIREKIAIVCHKKWSIEGSRNKGQQMTNEYIKLMARAFNNECDAAVLKVRWNNISSLEERIKHAYEVINKLGAMHDIVITNNYFNLKLDELHLAHEYQEKLYQEKEEQRRIAEQMREEQKVRDEVEKAKMESENEEKWYQKALERATAELDRTKGKEFDELKDKIASLQEQLKNAQEKKERAASRAELVKSGHVYVLSNIGSFGDNVYKIGMTRRLEPMDRVKELGDASVPFAFDVHAMIYSDNAPALENELQQAFDKRRVNMVNNRKEFFKVALKDIEEVALKKKANIEFAKIAEAKEYRETQALLVQENKQDIIPEKNEEKFPVSL